jgi:hypothetical protein
MDEVQIVHGPTAGAPGGITYSITLANGHIVTNPGGFGDRPAGTPSVAVPIIVRPDRWTTGTPDEPTDR